jgi:hypothetical protein
MEYLKTQCGLLLVAISACSSGDGSTALEAPPPETSEVDEVQTLEVPAVGQIEQAASCPSFTATNAEQQLAGRARVESLPFLFFRFDFYYAIGTDEYLGLGADLVTTVYEVAPGSYSLNDGGCGGGEPGGTCLKPGSGDYAQRGPYRVRREVIDLGPGMAPGQTTGEFTMFYPEPFEPDCPHPIAAWGNGTLVTGPDVYGFFHENAASWGVTVIASHDPNTGSGEYHKTGLDYLIAQNANPDSKFFLKLSPRAGVSGHSQGGAGAARAATHPNVEALIPVGFSGAPLNTAYLCLTGTADIAPAGCRTTTALATGPALAAIWEGGDHVRTETLLGYITGDPGTIQMMRLYTAWYRCYLADDPNACSLFEGPSCGICSDPGWAELVRRNL